MLCVSIMLHLHSLGYQVCRYMLMIMASLDIGFKWLQNSMSMIYGIPLVLGSIVYNQMPMVVLRVLFAIILLIFSFYMRCKWLTCRFCLPLFCPFSWFDATLYQDQLKRWKILCCFLTDFRHSIQLWTMTLRRLMHELPALSQVPHSFLSRAFISPHPILHRSFSY